MEKQEGLLAKEVNFLNEYMEDNRYMEKEKYKDLISDAHKPYIRYKSKGVVIIAYESSILQRGESKYNGIIFYRINRRGKTVRVFNSLEKAKPKDKVGKSKTLNRGVYKLAHCLYSWVFHSR